MIGPGSKIVISLGNEGSVVKLIRRWRPIDLSSKTMVRQAELISQAQAEEQLKVNMVAGFGEKATYSILNTRKAYWDGNGSLLQPVYAFETIVTLPERTVKPFQFISVVNMLKNPRESIVLQLDPEAKKMIRNYKDIQKTEPSDKND